MLIFECFDLCLLHLKHAISRTRSQKRRSDVAVSQNMCDSKTMTGLGGGGDGGCGGGGHGPSAVIWTASISSKPGVDVNSQIALTLASMLS